MSDADTPKTPFRLDTFFRSLLHAFWPAAYGRLGGQPASMGAKYLISLAFLVTLLLAPLLYIGQQDLIALQRHAYEEGLPAGLVFEDGHATFDGEMPYLDVDQHNEHPYVFMIDTTGQTTQVPDEYEAGTLVTESAIITKIPASNGPAYVREEPIPETEGRIEARMYYIEQLEAHRWRGFLFGVGQIFLGTGLLLFAFAGLATMLCFLAEMTRTDGRLPLATCFSMTTYAVTPLAFTIPVVVCLSSSLVRIVLVVSLAMFILLLVRGAQVCRATMQQVVAVSEPKRSRAR